MAFIEQRKVQFCASCHNTMESRIQAQALRVVCNCCGHDQPSTSFIVKEFVREDLCEDVLDPEPVEQVEQVEQAEQVENPVKARRIKKARTK